ncbi:MAG TPA: YfiR family protein [Rudaea sp.]|nr:YfiR family protein [Rudaea sp.]
MALAPCAFATTPQEYISGFVLYVRWPDDAAIKRWQICVARPSDAADAHYAELVVRERPFELRRVAAGDALASCQILDLTGADVAAAEALLKAAQSQRGLLTVGTGRVFCSGGGLICLRADDARGGFEINLSGMKNAGFSINARLLMLARTPTAEASP